MSALAKSDCDLLRLERCQSGAACDSDWQWLEQHLDACTECRHRLESSAEIPFWTVARDSLSTRRETRIQLPTQFCSLEDLSRTLSPCDLSDKDSVLRIFLHSWLAPIETWQEQRDVDSEPGSRVAIGVLDKYLVRRVIGIGGMGLVFEAWDPALRRAVAIKTLLPSLMGHAESRARFAREARMAASLRHPHIIPIFHVDHYREVPYLVMPYLPTGSLANAMHDSRIMHRQLGITEALKICRQVAEGLAAAHACGVIHRDIKPSNILFDANADRVVISDFGLARTAEDNTLSLHDTVLGTPQFMSPEQARGEPVDARSDLFSLGSLLYFLLCGRSPFDGPSTLSVLQNIGEGKYAAASTVRNDVAPWLDRLLACLLAPKMHDRLQTANEAAELLGICERYMVAPERNALPPKLRRAVVPRLYGPRRYAGILACICVVSAVVLFSSLWINNTRDAQNSHADLPGDTRPSDTEDVASRLPLSSNAPVEHFSSEALQRSGPLDELDLVNLEHDLRKEQRVHYWLERLQKLGPAEIPSFALPSLEILEKSPDVRISRAASAVLAKNPFLETELTNPFELIDDPTSNSTPLPRK